MQLEAAGQLRSPLTMSPKKGTNLPFLRQKTQGGTIFAHFVFRDLFCPVLQPI